MHASSSSLENNKISARSGAFFDLTGQEVNASMTMQDITNLVEKYSGSKIRRENIDQSIVPMRGNVFDFFDYTSEKVSKLIISTANAFSRSRD